VSDYLATYAAHLDREPTADEQWALDHPDGEIPDEEAAAMDEYAALSTHDTAPARAGGQGAAGGED